MNDDEKKLLKNSKRLHEIIDVSAITQIYVFCAVSHNVSRTQTKKKHNNEKK